MKRNGFTLVEVIVVIGITAVLMAIGTLNFNKMMKKSAISTQVKMLYSELMGVRVQAMYQKQARLVELAGKKAVIYETDVNTSPVVAQKDLSFPIIWGGSSNIIFDTKGHTNVSAVTGKSICIMEENDAAYDSIVISATRIQMGKRKDPLGGCTIGNIETE